MLVVEDDCDVATGVAALLELEGMSVQIAENGAKAIAVAGSWSPQLAVIDVCLPDMYGDAAYRRMSGDLPVIFSSGEASDERLRDLIARPNVLLLVKPYEFNELYAAIRKLLA
ncbi:MAG TPA: response regulator [Thermoanaerobaculia bacterium]|nr:response regulator [Thermoanaerobaculia bacterium]